MPRSNRPRRSARSVPGAVPGRGRGRSGGGRPPLGAGGDDDQGLLGAAGLGLRGARIEEHPDGPWVVRQVTGAAATKGYRCPGCDQEIRAGTPHVVAWPAETAVGAFGGPEDRRHWHSPCWAARRRRPRR